MLTKYMACVRYYLLTNEKTDMESSIAILSDADLLQEVLKLYDVKLDGASIFDQVRKAYNRSVLDANWAEKLYLIERAHWVFVAKFLFTQTEWVKPDENPLSYKGIQQQ
jgi:hypothetical protein